MLLGSRNMSINQYIIERAPVIEINQTEIASINTDLDVFLNAQFADGFGALRFKDADPTINVTRQNPHFNTVWAVNEYECTEVVDDSHITIQAKYDSKKKKWSKIYHRLVEEEYNVPKLDEIVEELRDITISENDEQKFIMDFDAELTKYCSSQRESYKSTAAYGYNKYFGKFVGLDFDNMNSKKGLTGYIKNDKDLKLEYVGWNTGCMAIAASKYEIVCDHNEEGAVAFLNMLVSKNSMKLFTAIPADCAQQIEEYIREINPGCGLPHKTTSIPMVKMAQLIYPQKLLYWLQRPGEMVFGASRVIHSAKYLTFCLCNAINVLAKTVSNADIMLLELNNIACVTSHYGVCEMCPKTNVAYGLLEKKIYSKIKKLKDSLDISHNTNNNMNNNVINNLTMNESVNETNTNTNIYDYNDNQSTFNMSVLPNVSGNISGSNIETIRNTNNNNNDNSTCVNTNINEYNIPSFFMNNKINTNINTNNNNNNNNSTCLHANINPSEFPPRVINNMNSMNNNVTNNINNTNNYNNYINNNMSRMPNLSQNMNSFNNMHNNINNYKNNNMSCMPNFSQNVNSFNNMNYTRRSDMNNNMNHNMNNNINGINIFENTTSPNILTNNNNNYMLHAPINTAPMFSVSHNIQRLPDLSTLFQNNNNNMSNNTPIQAVGNNISNDNNNPISPNDDNDDNTDETSYNYSVYSNNSKRVLEIEEVRDTKWGWNYCGPKKVPTQAINNVKGGRWKCYFCPKTFSKRSGLENHQLIHISMNKKPFICRYITNDKPCGKRYKYEGTLKDHTRDIHLGIKHDCTCGVAHNCRADKCRCKNK